ncbi:hypothetical protein Fot_27558 [Forsythia ovata]|uniref:Uncharacterized protein n=1 Tax=Forsythia ovata TaxID=205694 RepID=A0ABD1TLH4_9LAMI
MTRAAHVDIAKRRPFAPVPPWPPRTWTSLPPTEPPASAPRPWRTQPIRQVSNCHIIQNNVEILRPAYQTLSNEGRHMRTLCEQLVRIKLSNNSFKNFVSDR